jgi:hypothetical protein|uniref:Uncharacterized protein n=1 Tax=viral metagenome TaxID=1070528 RepID=A0A6C0CZF5_9ZZZZ
MDDQQRDKLIKITEMEIKLLKMRLELQKLKLVKDDKKINDDIYYKNLRNKNIGRY